MASGARFWSTLARDALRFETPVAVGSSGLSGKTSNRWRPRISSRLVMVACRYASLAATIVKVGVNTRYNPGADSNRARKSGCWREDEDSAMKIFPAVTVGQRKNSN
jgi:hypothetical protein